MFLFALAKVSSAIYVPGYDDWTELIPESLLLEGSFDTVPFPFGIVVSSFVGHDGSLKEPIVHGRRLFTTTFTSTYTTETPRPTQVVDPAKQINDGQVQHHPTLFDEDEEEEECNFSQIRKKEDSDCEDEEVDLVLSVPVYSFACAEESTLLMTLKGGILRDSQDRIGSIVSSHQFQFDGPIPQHGTIFANGWSVSKDGRLAIGNTTTFYQCASGNFFNLYDKKIAFQCSPVNLEVVELIKC